MNHNILRTGLESLYCRRKTLRTQGIYMVFNLHRAVGNKQRIFCFNLLFSRKFSTQSYFGHLNLPHKMQTFQPGIKHSSIHMVFLSGSATNRLWDVSWYLLDFIQDHVTFFPQKISITSVALPWTSTTTLHYYHFPNSLQNFTFCSCIHPCIGLSLYL